MKRLIKRLGPRLSSIADGFTHRVGRWFSPATNHTPPPTPQPRTNLLVSLLRNHIQAEDYFLKHAHQIEEYGDKTYQEWRKFIQDEQELERRKNLLLQSIGQGLVHYAWPHTLNAPIVLKTPDADNVNLLPRLFPQSKVLFIVVPSL